MDKIILISLIFAGLQVVKMQDIPIKIPGFPVGPPPTGVPQPPTPPPQVSPDDISDLLKKKPPIYVPSLRVPPLPLSSKDRLANSISLGTVSMPLDHFNSTNTARFDMRYAVNPVFYVNGTTKAMYIFIGGEENMDPMVGYLTQGVMYDTAYANKALMLMTEHRFYGLSIPNMDLSIPNMKYLTVDQAMADLADFISLAKTVYKIPKVVVFGGSYPGSLAAWMRYQYPNLVDVAVSSSGIAKVQVDNYGYNEVVYQAFKNYSVACFNTIYNGLLNTTNYLAAGYWSYIQSKFQLSYAPVTLGYQQSFINSLAVSLGNVVQYDKQSNLNSIANVCSNMTKNSATKSNFDRFSAVMANALLTGVFIQATGSQDDSMYSWLYQVCTELGNFVTSDSLKTFYNGMIPLYFWTDYCMQYYFNQANANFVFDGNCKLKGRMTGLPNATHIIYTIGETDPWREVGMLTPPNANTKVLYVKGSSHCAVLTPASQVNSTALTSARNTIKSLITTWTK